MWQYGEAQDTAQSQTSDGQSALANFTTTLTVSGSSFSYTFPAYSMTVLDLGPSSGRHGRPDDHDCRSRNAQPGDRHDHRPVGLGWRPRRRRLD